MNPREVAPGIVEFGPFYASDFARRDPDATRGGYFVAAGREFHWYHQARDSRLAPEWEAAKPEEIALATTWSSRDRVLGLAHDYLMKVAMEKSAIECEEVAA